MALAKVLLHIQFFASSPPFLHNSLRSLRLTEESFIKCTRLSGDGLKGILHFPPAEAAFAQHPREASDSA
jgi:hypothetical protein